MNKNSLCEKSPILALQYQNRSFRQHIPNKPGIYKWYATKEALEKLLAGLSLRFEDIPLEEWETKNDLYCIYVGITKALRRRLNQHIKGKHSLKNVSGGFLSTFRQLISSILFLNQAEEEETTDFINGLFFSYYPLEEIELDLQENQKTLEEKETELINSSFHPLNVAKNESSFLDRKLLADKRRAGKENALVMLKKKKNS